MSKQCLPLNHLSPTLVIYWQSISHETAFECGRYDWLDLLVGLNKSSNSVRISALWKLNKLKPNSFINWVAGGVSVMAQTCKHMFPFDLWEMAREKQGHVVLRRNCMIKYKQHSHLDWGSGLVGMSGPLPFHLPHQLFPSPSGRFAWKPYPRRRLQ